MMMDGEYRGFYGYFFRKHYIMCTVVWFRICKFIGLISIGDMRFSRSRINEIKVGKFGVRKWKSEGKVYRGFVRRYLVQYCIV